MVGINFDSTEKYENVGMPAICSKEKGIVKSTWPFIVENFQKIGTATFERWLTTHPELLDIFPVSDCSNLEEVLRSPFLKSHLGNIKRTLKLIVDKIDEDELLVNKIHGLGKRHSKYGAIQKYANAFGDIFLLNVSACKEWEMEETNAWVNLIGFVIDNFNVGLESGLEAKSI